MSSKWQTRITLLRQLSQQYDNHAWQDFVGYYESYIRMVLRRLGVTDGELDDLSQDVLVRTWKALPSYEKREDVKFRSWLGLIVRNCAFGWHNKSRRLQTVSIDAGELDEPIAESDLDLIIESEWKNYIATLAWNNIESEFSTVVLKVFEKAVKGCSNIAIGDELGLKANTVAVYKKRVRQALYREIARLDYELSN